MVKLDERPRYEPGFGVAWARLPILVVGGLAAAVGVAWLLKFAYVNDWYLLMVLAAVGGFALGGVFYALVGWTHCRSPWLAGGLALVAGLVGYLGYYQLALAHNLPGLVWHVDLLPRYIKFRMETDVAVDVGGGNVGARKPFEPLNWFMFGMELLVMAGAPAAFAWNRARRAYSAELGQWLRREIALLPAGSGSSFCAALQGGQLSEFIAAAPPASDGQMSCRLILEYADPRDASVLQYPIYASLEDFPGSRRWYRPRQLRQMMLRQLELEPDEVLALRPLFPELGRLLEAQHGELRQPADVVTAVLAESPVTEVAEINPVPEPYRQRVRGKGYTLAVNLRGAIPLVYFLGGAAAAGLGVWQVVEGSLALGGLLIAAGVPAVAWGAYTAIYCLGVFENRWIERRLRQEISQRSGVLVDAEDPDGVFVSLMPRESFAKIQWTMATDLLLLKLDGRRRQVLLEGDTDRYRIPAGAIAACEAQCFFHPTDPQRTTELWMVRLLIQLAEGARELLLSVSHTRWTPMTNARRRRVAEEMCQRISGLGGESTRIANSS